jgi:hypothetical protein
MQYVEGLDDEDFAEAEEEPYRVTRLLLAPEYRDLPDDQIEGILAAAFPGMEAEDAENFLGDLGRAFSGVGREIVRRGPDILAGAARGGSVGMAAGPYGALLGAGLGALTGGLSGGQAPAAARPGAPAPAAPTGPAPTAIASAPGVPAGAATSGQQLAAMFAQPQTWQAALTSLLGAPGRQTLPAGGGQVPVSSVLAALGTLATRTAEDLAAEADGESVPLYLMDAEGSYAVDPANPDARAERLLSMLGEANILASIPEYEEDYEYDESDEGLEGLE